MNSQECAASKTCNKCGQDKPLTEYNRNKPSKDGYLNRCKLCNKKILQGLKNTSPEIYERQLERGRKYKSLNKESIKLSKLAWDEANREHIKTYNKSQYDSDIEHHLARAKSYRKANPEKVKEASRRWELNNPEKHRTTKRRLHAKRRAIKKHALPAWANQTKIAEFYKEAVRLTGVTGIKYHVDHIVPLLGKNVCGLHVEGNLQVITAEENIRKNNRF